MSIQRFLLTIALSCLVMTTLSWLWHYSFMGDLYAEHTALTREVVLERLIDLNGAGIISNTGPSLAVPS